MTAARVLPLLLAVSLSGCGSWFGGAKVEPPAELVTIDKDRLIEPQLIWRRDIGAGTDDQRLNLRPWVEAGRVYVADGSGSVHVFEADSGKSVWEVETKAAISGGPGVGVGIVVVGTSDAEILALDEASGAERWRKRLSSEVLSTPAVAVDTVVVHTGDGKLFGLDAETGEERWRYEREIPILTLRGSSSPVIDAGVAYCGLAGGKLLALDLGNGSSVWEANITLPTGRSELERLADIDGDPILYGAAIFVATFQGDVAAVSAATGEIFWRRKLSSYNSLAADWQNIYASDAQGHVWAMEADSGAARWRQEALHNRKLSAPAVLGDYVVVGDFDGYLHWLSVADGSLVGRTRVGSDAISAAPRVVDDALYVLGDDGDLAVYRAPDKAQ